MSLDNSFILFEIQGGSYGLRCADVQRIEMLEHITPVPNTAPAVEGVVFSRGRVFPALNLRVRFGMSREPHTPRTRLVFLKVGERVVALIVDSAREFYRIDPTEIRPVEESLVGIHGSYVEGVTSIRGRSVLILKVDRLLTLEETQLPHQTLAPAVHLTSSEAF